jgi:serine/threonine-protein kinase
VIAQATSRSIPRSFDVQAESINGVEMVEVPAGCFLMGSVLADADPVHRQCFDDPFWMDRYEVSREQYDICVQAQGCEEIATNPYSSQVTQPINNITWYQARDYCRWRGVRLPTEAEWEYAARGSDSWIYPWGDVFDENIIIFARNHRSATADVGGRIVGASWVGAEDMSGNVWEWTSTIFGEFVDSNTLHEFEYPYVADDGREDLERTNVVRIRRGGGFDNFEDGLKAAEREARVPTFLNANSGVRCALSETPDD